MPRFLIFMGVLSLLLDFYVYQGVKSLTNYLRSARLRKIARWGFWFVTIGFFLLFCLAMYQRNTTDIPNSPFTKWVMNLFLAFFVSKFVFILVLFAEDIIRALVLGFRMLTKTKHRSADDETMLPTRRKFMSLLATGLAAAPFAAFIYGMVKGKYDYRVHRHVLYFDDLPPAFDGFKLVQLSDIHAGSFDDPVAVQRGIDMVKAQKADLFVFTGDLVNNYATEIQPYINHFKQITAPFGQFSVLGNHDYGMYAKWPSKAAEARNLEDLKQHQHEMGYRLLLDESVMLEKNGEKIALVGVENWGEGFIQKGDLDRALTNVDKDAFKILLSHDPSHWEDIVKKHPTKVHLTLSGHTHGMQFGVETPAFRWSPVQYRYKNWAGPAEENGRKLYVNRGFGFIGYSGRFGIWPEITVLELRRKTV